MNRALDITTFLAQQGWDAADQWPLDADFSPRRYARLDHPDGKRAWLMDADPDQKTPEFVEIAKLLRELGVYTPEIFAADPENGLVLMEYLGNQNIGRLLDSGAAAKPLYRRATDILIHLHQKFDPATARDLDLPLFGGALFGTQVELFLDYYIPYIKGREAAFEESESFRAAWKTTLKGIEALPQTLMLRDFMPDNLMSMPDNKIGVLDFQDAGLGPFIYDIASLCEMVRRDGGDAMLTEIIAYYHERVKPALSIAELTRACHILSAQRHMRILGIVARMAAKGRTDKLAFLPRIQGYLSRLLEDEALKPVREWVRMAGISL
jgi:aminoglycoside/choline kinase family phosphotransferase